MPNWYREITTLLEGIEDEYVSDQEIIQRNLSSARKHLVYALINQGIDWDEACDQAKSIEDRFRAMPGMNDEWLGTELLSAAAPYEDM